MSSVIAEPNLLAEAAAKLHTINAALRAGNAAAAGPTTGVTPAAGDLVSALTAAQFARTRSFTRRSALTPRGAGVAGDHARRQRRFVCSH